MGVCLVLRADSFADTDYLKPASLSATHSHDASLASGLLPGGAGAATPRAPESSASTSTLAAAAAADDDERNDALQHRHQRSGLRVRFQEGEEHEG